METRMASIVLTWSRGQLRASLKMAEI